MAGNGSGSGSGSSSGRNSSNDSELGTLNLSRLTAAQQEALQQYSMVTDQELDAAVPLLERSQWNVQVRQLFFLCLWPSARWLTRWLTGVPRRSLSQSSSTARAPTP